MNCETGSFTFYTGAACFRECQVVFGKISTLLGREVQVHKYPESRVTQSVLVSRLVDKYFFYDFCLLFCCFVGEKNDSRAKYEPIFTMHSFFVCWLIKT